MKPTILCCLALALAAPAITQETQPMSESDNPSVVMETSLGAITIRLFADKAPISVENFLGYVDDGFYAGTIFHRVIKNFMIQGGGFDKDMNRRETRAPIKNEATNGLKNKRGTIAMARLPQPDTATSQFFINVVDNRPLDHVNTADRYGYAVFGEVSDGMDVVDKIRAVATGRKGHMSDVPLETVEIISVKRTK